MSEERLREALEAVLTWHESYDDYMSGDDLEKREAAGWFARKILMGDETATLEGVLQQMREEKRKRAEVGPRLVMRFPGEEKG